jgi:hypothetical protein
MFSLYFTYTAPGKPGVPGKVLRSGGGDAKSAAEEQEILWAVKVKVYAMLQDIKGGTL